VKTFLTNVRNGFPGAIGDRQANEEGEFGAKSGTIRAVQRLIVYQLQKL
jgi:hypothetical protein